MSDDPDLPKANYALQVLRQARLSRNETAARMVEHLAYVTTNTGLRTPEIEETQQAGATSNPSLSSSPWMRGAPQSGFSTLIRRINARISVSICGRPPRGRDFQRQ